MAKIKNALVKASEDTLAFSKIYAIMSVIRIIGCFVGAFIGWLLDKNNN